MQCHVFAVKVNHSILYAYPPEIDRGQAHRRLVTEDPIWNHGHCIGTVKVKGMQVALKPFESRD